MAKTEMRDSDSSPFRPADKAGPNTDDTQILVNKLTVGDARRLLLHEGAERSLIATVVDLCFILVTAGLVAQAIWVWDATYWHIVLPLLAQYVALNTCIPILQAVYRLPNFRKNVFLCLGNIVGWVVIAVVVVSWRVFANRIQFTQQLHTDFETAMDWIVNHQMHWPIAAAYVGFAITLPTRFRAYLHHGPPFVSVSFGCAIRILILFLFFFISWMFMFATPEGIRFSNDYGAWIVWGLLLIADLLAWYGLFHIRCSLKRLECADQSVKSH